MTAVGLLLSRSIALDFLDFLLLNAIYRVVFVSCLALMVDIEFKKKARFVCFLFLFVGELVLYLQSLLLIVSFQ